MNNATRHTQRGSSEEWFLIDLFLLWCVAAWVTHVIVCLATASWGFLVAGALLAPIAVIHGTGLWFQLW